MEPSFEEFMRRRLEAAQAYVCGDPDPLTRIAAQGPAASFFAPDGRVIVGSDVLPTYVDDAKSFGAGSDTRFEVLGQGTGGDLAYWVGYQHATVRFVGRDNPVAMKLRITELFRREGGDWKLIHRHAESV